MLTEKQRLEAIEACDRIVAINTELQQRCQNILKIFEELAKPKTVSQPPHETV